MSSKRTVIIGYRIGFALLAIAAIVAQISKLIDRDTFVWSNFFSYFTIQSNLLAIAILLYGGIRLAARPAWDRRDFLRSGITLYLSLTGLVYGILLSGYSEGVQTTLPWVDTVLHRIIPIVMVADWIIDPPQIRIDFRKALAWLIYPLAYLVYTLIRGPIVDWYPYPFLNPDDDATGGYLGVALYCVGIAIGLVVAVRIMVWLTNRREREQPAPAPAT